MHTSTPPETGGMAGLMSRTTIHTLTNHAGILRTPFYPKPGLGREKYLPFTLQVINTTVLYAKKTPGYVPGDFSYKMTITSLQ